MDRIDIMNKIDNIDKIDNMKKISKMVDNLENMDKINQIQNEFLTKWTKVDKYGQTLTTLNIDMKKMTNDRTRKEICRSALLDARAIKCTS